MDATDLTQEEGFECSWRKLFRFFKQRRTDYYSPKELEEKITKLHKYCLTHLVDSYRVHLYRMKGIGKVRFCNKKKHKTVL